MLTKLKNKIFFLLSLIFLVAFPQLSLALNMPINGSELASIMGVDAQAYAVMDAKTGQVLISKNSDLAWPPASLTKLVTALVVLDTKPKFYKSVVMGQQDEIAGFCKNGGACIKSRPGVKFTVDALFHAALMPSANNAASALSRSTGLSAAEFVDRMNQKARLLGATHSHFNEPTGMDPANVITAGDYAKIIAAAFNNQYLRNVSALPSYNLYSVNNPRYNQVIKNTDKLLKDSDVQIVGAKTGYLDEANYNFASLLTYRGGQELAVVVLGERHLYSAFAETKLLASLAETAQALALQNLGGAVLGASQQANAISN